MTLSRSPSPKPTGGWTTPGLSSHNHTPKRTEYAGMNGYASNDAHWAAAKAKSAQLRGYPQIQSRNEGFFQRSKRKISSALPRYNSFGQDMNDWRNTEKLGRGRWTRQERIFSELKTFVGNVLRRFKFLFLMLAIILAFTTLMSQTNMRSRYRRSSKFGGGSKFVIILAANEGGGVMEWKGPREWAIERDSIKNKQRYADTWGYDLEISDMATKKKYAHEWRESWEKVDVIRNCMVKYPKAEWFWWLDLNTFIMEPSYSLQHHIFNNLAAAVYRDINIYNPLQITHPLQSELVDPLYTSPTSDNQTSSIDLIVPQDCAGFNLGSFFVRRSTWTDRLLDIWWDPVLYEQKHMQWEHKEQDALEHLYTNQAWVRTRVAFIQQRMINSFPPGACRDAKVDKERQKAREQAQAQGIVPPVETDEVALDPRFHYHESDRDFLVNMAGCEWGRDCWAEMYQYRELSKKLNRSFAEKAHRWWRRVWNRMRSPTTGKDINLEEELA